MKSFPGKTLLFSVVALAIGILAGKYIFDDRTLPAPPTSTLQNQKNTAETTVWTCSMHPQIRQPKAGKCPLCFMDLIPIKNNRTNDEGGEAGIKLSPYAEKLAGIETAPVERKFVPAEIRMFGKVAYNEETMSIITARMPGRIDKLFVNYTGIAVKKGEHIAEIYSPELLLAQQEVFQALKIIKNSKPDDEFAQRTMFSVKEKYRLWGFSEEQLNDIISKKKVSDRMTITAPMSGIVIEKEVMEGKYFITGEKLFTIADLSLVWINLDAYESDLPFIRYGENVEFRSEAYPDKIFTGRIVFIQPVLNEMTRTVKVRLNADNPHGNLKPGMFVNAVLRVKISEDGEIAEDFLVDKWICSMHPAIIKDKPGSCDVCGMPLVTSESLGFTGQKNAKLKPPLLIPATAPLITGKRSVVYVALKDNPGHYEGREIIMGQRVGDYYIVKSGLSEGDLVVVNGNFKIDSSLQILAKPSMMNPKEGTEKDSSQMKGTEKGTQDLSVKIDGAMLDAYFAIGKALSIDNLEGVKKSAGGIDDKYFSMMASSKDIKTAREIFAEVSTAIFSKLKVSGQNTKSTYKYFCPMAFDNKGAIWLQDNNEIANPYFGSVMPKCGELQETLSDSKAK